MWLLTDADVVESNLVLLEERRPDPSPETDGK
jgi:hypothetical protein